MEYWKICNGLSGRVKRGLAGHEGVGKLDRVIVAGVLDGNCGLVVVDESKDVDGLVLAGAEGVTEEVPEPVSKEILFGDKT